MIFSGCFERCSEILLHLKPLSLPNSEKLKVWLIPIFSCVFMGLFYQWYGIGLEYFERESMIALSEIEKLRGTRRSFDRT